jgi:hypothetical protein
MVRISNGAKPLLSVTRLLPSHAGSITSTYLCIVASPSIIACKVRLADFFFWDMEESNGKLRHFVLPHQMLIGIIGHMRPRIRAVGARLFPRMASAGLGFQDIAAAVAAQHANAWIDFSAKSINLLISSPLWLGVSIFTQVLIPARISSESMTG